MENSSRSEICNVNVHRASMQKHLGIRKHLEIEKLKEMIIPERLYKEKQSPVKIKIMYIIQKHWKK